jgi:peptidoglycan/LPS O-acetylase OafA/YrhL
LVIMALLVALLALDDAFTLLSVVLTGLAFALIAGGCRLGGVLTASGSRLLGESAYGLYLLHGFVLYMAYRLVAAPWPAGVSESQWTLLTWACTPVVVLVSWASYRWLERPALAQTTRLTAWLRARRRGPPTPAPVVTKSK